MPIDNLEQRLANLNEHFQKADASADPFALPEPGSYNARLRIVDFFEAKASGAAFLKLSFEIFGSPDYEGKTVDIVHCLEPQRIGAATPDQIEMKFGFLKRDLELLGVDTTEDGFHLGLVYPGSAIWDSALDRAVALTIYDAKKINESTGKPYRNAKIEPYIGSDMPVVGTPIETGVPSGGGMVPSQDIPFGPCIF
ncbi:hypothetical protein NBH00_05060 [Paraconexibacter antarcticus]|uniref:Uncharacterized protein n=1 Tax=Paraconexibacter antarcticus TaxID=2949664 RepID=A0ABY5DXA9_9ACTN|nr:hypothetical protein [Paraconexibacter antarcticus]UTI65579.1 hypothetical protein NBH00_05060 [Paraconexibacter antarcticus]